MTIWTVGANHELWHSEKKILPRFLCRGVSTKLFYLQPDLPPWPHLPAGISVIFQQDVNLSPLEASPAQRYPSQVCVCQLKIWRFPSPQMPFHASGQRLPFKNPCEKWIQQVCISATSHPIWLCRVRLIPVFPC